MKKLFTIILVLAVTISLTACADLQDSKTYCHFTSQELNNLCNLIEKSTPVHADCEDSKIPVIQVLEYGSLGGQDIPSDFPSMVNHLYKTEDNKSTGIKIMQLYKKDVYPTDDTDNVYIVIYTIYSYVESTFGTINNVSFKDGVLTVSTTKPHRDLVSPAFSHVYTIIEIDGSDIKGNVDSFKLDITYKRTDGSTYNPNEMTTTGKKVTCIAETFHAGYGAPEEMINSALNSDKLDEDISRLPIWKFETKDEYDTFIESYSSRLSTENLKDDAMDDEFFEENTVLVVYIELGSGSFLYKAHEITLTDSSVSVGVVNTYPKDYCITCDMSGKFIRVIFDKDDIKSVTSFDAEDIGHIDDM